MQILNSTLDDMETIFGLYGDAVAYQKLKFNKHWQGFDHALVQKEIEEQRQFKIVLDNVVVCIFAITFNDAGIWKELDKSPSLYIHRIVTRPGFRSNGYVKNIITWALNYCRNNAKQFVRMDTWGDNEKLITYYQNCGFIFLGLTDEIRDETLPKHYQGIRLSLFQIAVNET